uniref:Putative LOC101846883 [Aplysia californica] n=1 Tax=Lepeophtheirus salmonis TaxID=72036 RepID=A0A0K2TUX6_LEPSM
MLNELVKITASEETSVTLLRRYDLLRSNPPNCEVCQGDMTEVKYRKTRIWRCTKHKTVRKTLRHGSFFERSKLDLSQLLLLLHLWVFETSIKDCATLTKIDKNTIIEWYRSIRQVCSDPIITSSYKIGGPGKIVQIDESLFGKTENNAPIQKCVFGGYCPENDEGFLSHIPDRSSEAILSTIQNMILPGSIIHSYDRETYRGIEELPMEPPYEHFVVNDDEDFVNPFPAWIHTTDVKCFLKNVKLAFNKMAGVHSSTLSSHLNEFMWRQKYGLTPDSCIENLFSHLSECYPITS